MNEIEQIDEKKKFIENFVNKINEGIKASGAKISHFRSEADGDTYQISFGKSFTHFKINNYEGDWVTFIKQKLLKKALSDQE